MGKHVGQRFPGVETIPDLREDDLFFPVDVFLRCVHMEPVGTSWIEVASQVEIAYFGDMLIVQSFKHSDHVRA